MTATRDEGAAKRRTWLLVGAALVVAIALFFLLRKPTSSNTLAPSVARSSSDGNGSASSSKALQGVMPGGLGPARPLEQQEMTDEEREAWRSHMEDTRKVFLEKTKYPPTSLPLAGKFDLIDPHHIEQTRRPLMQNPETKGPGNTTITQWQSQLWLGDGETASAFVAVTTQDGTKPTVEFTRAMLHRADEKTDGPGALIEPVIFHDDGVAPDTLAGDNIFSVTIPPRADMLRGVTSGLLLDVEMSADAEHGSFRFNFATTGPAPARFTGVVTDEIAAGSLVFHVGIEVKRAGRYNIMARLYDAAGKPAALLTFVDQLTEASREVVLTAFGKTLRDQDLKAPFALKDIEGFCYAQNGSSDRAVMVVWPGPHVTPAFDMKALSDAEWDSPERTKESDKIDDTIAHGPSEIAPVDNDGIPLPPMPLVLPPAPKSSQ